MDALFRVKLQIPVVRQKLAPRIRIDKELNEGLEGKLTLLIAPAGYGKTTAVVKWTEQLDIPIVWFSIDNLDNSFKRFWCYLIAALETILPGLEERFSRYLYTANSIAAASIVAPLINEIYQYKNNFVLVIDDYHLIEEASIHESMALFLKYLPDHAHLIIISRNQLPFNSVRLQTIGHIKELRLSDLQFTSEEIAGLCQVKGILATPQEVTDLETWTEGWVAGLYLLLDTADKEQVNLSRPLGGSGSDQRIAAYLSEEVVKQWGEAENSFMMKTSILQALSGSLCDALTGRKDGQEMLQRLADHNAFIIAFDHEGGWYRYHHLFAEFLQKKLDSRLDIEKNKLHQQAGIWYESKGHFAEAIGHYIAGQHYEKAADLIEAKGREMLRTGVVEILINWLSLLPQELVEGRDLLCLTYAWALIISNKEKEAKHWVNKVEMRLSHPSAPYPDQEWKRQLQVEVVAAQGFIGLIQQNLMSTTKSMLKFQEIMWQGSIFLMSGINFNMGGASVIGGMFGLKGHLHIVEKEYVPIYEKIKTFMKKPNAYIPIMMAEILFERNRMDEALAMLAQGSKEAEESNSIGCLVPLTIIYARVLKSRGDIKGAFAVVRDGKEKLRKMGGMHLIPILNAFETRISIETGEQEALERWMMSNCLEIFDNPGGSNIFEYFTLVRVLMVKKSFDDSLLLLNKLKLFAEKENNLLCALEVHILLAIVYYHQGQTQKAMEALKKALIMGEMNGYERIFIEEGVPMAALLGRFVRSGFKKETSEKTELSRDSQEKLYPNMQDHSADLLPVSPVYVRRLLKFTRDYCITVKVFGTEKTKTAGSANAKKTSLTKREREILHLLDSELTNAEIACTLDISVNTVKVNCSNIYRKLEVRNRDQAVRVARELKIE
jgi:LuxR family maltose regulon positive regulatory protein